MNNIPLIHPNLRTRFQEAEDIEQEDSSIEITDLNGVVLGWIQILDRHAYRMAKDRYSYTIPDPKSATVFFVPVSEDWATFEEAGAAFVKRCAEEGIAI